MALTNLAPGAATRNLPARMPTRIGRDDSALAALSRSLGIDPSDMQEVRQIHNLLASRNINSVDALRSALDNGDDHDTIVISDRFQPPPPAIESASPLFSDVEVFDSFSIDTQIVDITTVAISSTLDFTLPQLPAKWSFTDFTAGGECAASGLDSKIEIQILLGTKVITKFRLDALRRTSSATIVVDALQKLYRYDIGPSSVVKCRVINGNSGVGMTFAGYFQYTYQPLDPNAVARIVSKMVAR